MTPGTDPTDRIILTANPLLILPLMKQAIEVLAYGNLRVGGKPGRIAFRTT
jgi:hypothetical protein